MGKNLGCILGAMGALRVHIRLYLTHPKQESPTVCQAFGAISIRFSFVAGGLEHTTLALEAKGYT